MARPPRLSHQDYKLGWICALSTELTAAMAMLDEIHPALSQHSQDDNTYTLGRVGEHNVVVACLPAGQIGNNSAATVASKMRYSFEAIRFGLMVGIGGGVPSEDHDVRLGDVVVSNPGKHSGGVIQYDFGRTVAEGRFVHNSSLNAPPTVLLTAVSTLRARHNLRGHELSHYLSAVDIPRLRPKYTYQGAENDVLFKAEYDHVSDDANCDECDKNMIVPRRARDGTVPYIHYGTIASGNQVMRDGKTRERWRRESDVLCFEMEAAGLMNNFPCLVIRGICDYADSHKSKRWQEYAAATAAAYAKELLYLIRGDQAARIQTAVEATSLTVASVALGRPAFTGTYEREESFASKSLQALTPDDPLRFLALSKRPEWGIGFETLSSYNIFEHLSDYEPGRIHRDYLRNRCPGTTNWILEDTRFVEWLEGRSNPCLWLSGKIGSGKTLVTSTAVQHMIDTSQDINHLVAHFFYSYSNRSRLKAAHLFRSYIKQIIGYFDMTGKQLPMRIISCIKRFYGPRRYYPKFVEIIEEIFIPLSDSFPVTTYVVDGLDECEQGEVRKVLKTFQKLMSHGGTKVFISGRETLNVTQSIPDSIAVAISDESNREDISRYIEWRIEEKMRERLLTDNQSVLEDIKRRLNEKADHMMLWVSLQLETLWDDCYSDADIQNALANMPKDLSEIYDRCLTRISGQNNRFFAQKILPWVCAVVRPFTLSQLREALAIDPVTGSLVHDNMPPAQEILKCCSNLIIQDSNDQILLAHYSVRQFLEDRMPDPQLFPTGLDLKARGLELGELCVMHLTSPGYTLALQRHNVREDMAVNAGPVFETIVEKLGQSIPYFEWLRLTKPRSVRIPWPSQPSRPTPTKEPLSFFHFAREQWAPLTNGIGKDSDCWEKFQALALKPNLSWRLHPWEPLGESLDSHFSGLLGWAIMNRHLPFLDLLLGLQNPKPRTDIYNLPFCHYSNLPPLHLASRVGDAETTQRLLQVCSPKKIDDTGRTALHHAAETGHKDVALLLIKKKVNLKAKDDKGQTALHIAAGNGYDGLALDIIMHGASVNMKDNAGRTALFPAVANGHESMVQLLFEMSVSINGKDNKRLTALFIAANNGHEAIVRLLLKLGADVNARDDDGRTVLSWAAENGHEAVVKLLLAVDGIDPNTRDKYGQTPLSWATKNRHDAVVKVLLAVDGINQAQMQEIDKGPQQECKVLLLGSLESGKSTIVKQMKILYLNGYTEEELALYRLTIYKNVVDSAKALIGAMRKFELELAERKNQEYADFLLEFSINPDPAILLGPEVGDAISSLWNDTNIPRVIERRTEFYLQDSAPYFFDEVKRIAADDYLPTEADVLRARTKTTGIYELRFAMGQLHIHMFDVGGSRSERKKWIYCFENVTSILFVVALSEYDQVLLEESSQNRMMESLVLFDSVCNARWFTKSSIILLLNKIDLFKQKMANSPLNKYFPDYSGGNDVNRAAKYFLWRFNQLNRAHLNIYPHLIEATNTANARLTFAAVKETILQNARKGSKLL